MKRMWILALIALAGCGSDPVVRAAAPPSTTPTAPAHPWTGCVPGAYDIVSDFTLPAPDAKPNPPPVAIAHALLRRRAFDPMQLALERAAEGFESAAAAHASSDSQWVVATDDGGNRVVADGAKEGAVPTHYVLEAADGRDLMQFQLTELAPGIWGVEYTGNC